MWSIKAWILSSVFIQYSSYSSTACVNNLTRLLASLVPLPASIFISKLLGGSSFLSGLLAQRTDKNGIRHFRYDYWPFAPANLVKVLWFLIALSSRKKQRFCYVKSAKSVFTSLVGLMERNIVEMDTSRII
jgi:hypothetical protein